MATYQAVRLIKLASTIEAGIDSLELVSMPRAALKPDQVRVQIYASCLNYYDLLILIGRYQYKPKLPTTLGSECAGVIIEVGSSVRDYRVGDRVLTAMSPYGCHASELVVSVDNSGGATGLIPVPPQLSLTAAAGVGVGFFTAYHALVQRGNMKPTHRLLVTGAGGGMGLSAIQIARALGCQCVIAACSTQEKAELAKKYGAHHAVVYGRSSSNAASPKKTATIDFKKQVEDATDGEGVDLVYEVVGGDVFNAAFRCVAPGGRLLVIGFASASVPSIPANLVLVKGIDIVGVRSGAEMMRTPQLTHEMVRELHRLCADADAGNTTSIVPHISKYEPRQIKQAYQRLNEAKILGKATVIWKEEQIKAKL